MVRASISFSKVKEKKGMFTTLRGSARVLSKEEQKISEKKWEDPAYRSKVLRSFDFDA